LRIRAVLPTIWKIIDQGGKAILASHLGRPKGKVAEEFSLKPVGAYLAGLLDRPVPVLSDCVGDEVRKRVAELRKLRGVIRARLARKQILESLQTDRSRTVDLLDQLVRQTPDGVYLKTVKQDGLKVNLTGYAQSNARVSAFMRNLQSSALVDNTQTSPQLVEIKASDVNKRRLSEFNMNFTIKRPVTEEDASKAGKAGAAKKG
jgi:Tfp pilus assembly protein PilN